jgi:nicotinate-nucleotide pyrophosphorylase (carboxylating)
VLFDNMSISLLKRCLKICNKKYETEYSGNASLKNVKKISKTGVNRISIGAITHSARAFDTSLLLG